MAERALSRQLQQAGPLTWLLAGVAGWALLAWVAALAGMGGRIGDPPVVAAAPLPQARPMAPDRIGPLVQYGEAASRPLFTQDRRPRSFVASNPEGDPGAGPATTLDFVLTGVLISPQVRLAILQPSTGGEPQRVREGSTPEGATGWRLVEVQPRAAVFEGSDGTRTNLDLRSFGIAGAPAAARAPAQPLPPPPPPGQSTATVAAANAANDAVPDQARIEAIRRRIEARRAQLRTGAAQPTNTSPPPPRPVPDANQNSYRPTGGEER